MRKLFGSSIRKQIIILVAAMAVVPMGIIIYSVEDQRRDDRRDAELALSRLVNEVSNDQSVLLSGAEQLLSTLAYLPAVRSRDAQAISELLSELTHKTPQITNLLMIDSTGLVWASALPMKGVVRADDRRFFKNAMATGRFSSGEFTIGRVLSKPALSFGYPIKDTAGRITDIATVAFTLTHYNRLLKLKRMPENTSLVLVDHKGTILFHNTNPLLIGKEDKLFGRMQGVADEGVFDAVGNSGINRMHAYQKIRMAGEETPYMYVRAGLPVSDLMNRTRAALFARGGLMLALTLMAFGFAVYLSKRGIIDKVVALQDATHKIASGNLDVRVSDYVKGGELGELGQAFDRMSETLIVDNERRKRAEDSLNRLNEELESRVKERTEELVFLNKELQAFSYSVSHDLRAPLVRLSGFVDILLDECRGKLTDQELHYLERIRSSGEKMRDLIDALLALSRVTSKELNFDRVNLAELATEIVAGVREQATGREIDFISPGSLIVQGDPALLKLALENLIGNAVKYSARKERTAIELGCFEDKGKTVYFVKDNGAGFDPAYSSELFAPFRRLHREEEFTGIGIGLATVQRIVRRHGGNIWADGSEGEGATFYFTLN